MRKPTEITKVDQSQLANLNDLIDDLYSDKMTVRSTSVLPTTSTVSDNELIVYDDGLGTKRLYVITGKGNLGYVNLT